MRCRRPKPDGTRATVRIAIFSQFFDPEPPWIPKQLATWLAEHGHTVTVVTGFPNYPTGKIYDGYKVKALQRERSGMIDIIRVPLLPSHSTSAAGRVANFSSFAASAATIGVAAVGRVDVAYAYGASATIGIPAVTLKMLSGVPFLLHVIDLWPESVVDSGMLPSGPVTSIASAVLDRVCRALYRAAGEIVVPSPGFQRALIERGAPADRISVVYNWADERVLPVPGDPMLARELQIDSPFVMMYSGNLGPFQGLDTAIRAAHELSDLEGFRLVIAGTGIAEAALHSLAADLETKNVTFLGYRPKSEMPRLEALADVHLVSLQSSLAMSRNIPSKVQSLFAAGRSVLFVGCGDAADLISRSGAGWVCDPEDPTALASTIRELARLSPGERARAGAAGRSFYDANLSLEIGAAAMQERLEALGRSRGHAG